MKYRIAFCTMVVTFFFAELGACQPLRVPDTDVFTREAAESMHAVATSTLAPVYSPLAEWLVEEFDLAGRGGIGLDVGGGPGSLTLELCKRTPRMFWINSDINTHFFPIFQNAAEEAGVGHRCWPMFADAQALPFCDNYADFIVSRGSLQFWDDLELALSDIYRVLKPGGVAFIGRGFSENLPIAAAKQIRSKQSPKSKALKYDTDDTERELLSIMRRLGVETYEIHRPQPEGSEGVKYGIWLIMWKAAHS